LVKLQESKAASINQWISAECTKHHVPLQSLQ
jgi:hypothetical protein